MCERRLRPSNIHTQFIWLISEQVLHNYENEKSELRTEICKAVTMSPFIFDNYNLIPYKKNVSSHENIVEDEPTQEESPYQLQEVTVNELNAKFQEHVFPCPAWNKAKAEIVNFYISNAHGKDNCRFLYEEKEQKKLFAIAIIEKVPEMPAFAETDNITEIKARMSALRKLCFDSTSDFLFLDHFIWNFF